MLSSFDINCWLFTKISNSNKFTVDIQLHLRLQYMKLSLDRIEDKVSPPHLLLVIWRTNWRVDTNLVIIFIRLMSSISFIFHWNLYHFQPFSISFFIRSSTTDKLNKILVCHFLAHSHFIAIFLERISVFFLF